MNRKLFGAAIFILLLSLLTAIASADEVEYILPVFVEYEKNPVVVPPINGFYYSPDILIENSGSWIMVHGGQAVDTRAYGDAIYIAFSEDGGNTWDREGVGLILPDGGIGAWDDSHVNDPSIVKLPNGTYLMAFTGAYGFGGNETDQIGLATTNNPKNGWTEVPWNPILPEGYSYDEYYPARPTMLFEDGVLKIWYDCRSTPYNYGNPPATFRGIAYATSTDYGATWTRHGLVIESDSGLGGPSVYRQDNDTLVMVAEEATGVRHFNWYTSSDGLSWVYRGQVVNPVAPWHTINGVSSADVLKDNDGRWRIYFAGGNEEIGSSWTIGFAYDIMFDATGNEYSGGGYVVETIAVPELPTQEREENVELSAPTSPIPAPLPAQSLPPELEPSVSFPKTWAAAAVIVTTIVVGASLIVYFKRRKR